MMPEGVKVPVGFIRRYWRQLQDAYVDFYGTVDETLEKKSFDRLVTITADVLNLGEPAVREALIPYYGRVVTPDMLNLMAFKMAGGRTRLVDSKTLSSQIKGTGQVWLAVFIADCDLVMYAVGEPKLHVTLIVASGEFAGVQFEVRVSLKYWSQVFPSVVGFPRWSTPNEREMVQMYFMGLFDVTDLGRIQLLDTGATSNMEATNNKIRSKRNAPCVEGYKSLCHHCWLGYSGKNKCSRACRAKTLVKSFCRKCGENSFFTPGTEHRDCVSCASKALRGFRQRVYT